MPNFPSKYLYESYKSFFFFGQIYYISTLGDLFTGRGIKLDSLLSYRREQHNIYTKRTESNDFVVVVVAKYWS